MRVFPPLPSASEPLGSPRCRPRAPVLALGMALACSTSAGGPSSETGPAPRPAASDVHDDAGPAVTPSASTLPPAFDPKWPATPDAKWPAGCLVWDVGVHPTLPWVTLACNKSDFGAILVIDAQSGALVSVSTADETVGWANEGLVLWDGTGTRLCTNAEGSGIALLERAAFVGLNHVADARDGATHYAWVDHRIYTDTNHLFDPERGVHFDVPASRELRWTIDGFRWNASIGAVVGQVDPTEDVVVAARRLVAYDPARDAVLYDRATGDIRNVQWSGNGRWVLAGQRPPSGGPAEVLLIDGNTGREARRFSPKLGDYGRMSVSDEGDVVVASSHRPAPTAAIDHATQLWRQGKPPVELPVRAGVDIAWSPDGSGMAWLDERRTITLVDVATARVVTTLSAPEPKAPGGSEGEGGRAELLWVGPARLAVVGFHYVSVYALDGSRVAEFVAPS